MRQLELRGTSWLAIVIAAGLTQLGCGSTSVDRAEDSAESTADTAAAIQAATWSLVEVVGPPPTATAGQRLPDDVVVQVRDRHGVVVQGAVVRARVARGGGRLSPAPPIELPQPPVVLLDSAPVEVLTDSEGRAVFSWTLGKAPVRNSLRIALVDDGKPAAPGLVLHTRGTLESPLAAETFGDVDGYLAANDYPNWASTEDLAFDGAGRLLLGIPGPNAEHWWLDRPPGGLLLLDDAGVIEPVTLSGDVDKVVAPLGITRDAEGNIWMADGRGHAVHRVSSDGEVETVLSVVSGDGLTTWPLVQPNYIAVGPEGRIYVSDPCRNKLLRFEPPVGQQSVDVQEHDFGLDQGGPNGFAFDASGRRLVVGTENTSVLCKGTASGSGPAQLFEIDLDSGFTAQQSKTRLKYIDSGVAIDGVAFDAEDNLYFVLNTREGLSFGNSVWVLPKGHNTIVPFLAPDDQALYANIAFGEGQFGETTLYIANIVINLMIGPQVDSHTRGVRRIDIGIPGLPLLR